MADQKIDFRVENIEGDYNEGDEIKIGLRVINRYAKAVLRTLIVKIKSTQGCSVSPSRLSIDSIEPNQSWRDEICVKCISEGIQSLIFIVEGTVYEKRLIGSKETPFRIEETKGFNISKVPIQLQGSLNLEGDTFTVGQPFRVKITITNGGARIAKIEAECKLPFSIAILEGVNKLSTEIPPNKSAELIFNCIFLETAIPSEYSIGPVYIYALDDLNRRSTIILKEKRVKLVKEEARIKVSKSIQKNTLFVDESTNVLLTIENQSSLKVEICVIEEKTPFIEIIQGSPEWTGTLNSNEKREIQYRVKGVKPGLTSMISIIEYKLSDGSRKFVRTSPLDLRVVERELNAAISTKATIIDVPRGKSFSIAYKVLNSGDLPFTASFSPNISELITLNDYSPKEFNLKPGVETTFETFYVAQKDGKDILSLGKLVIKTPEKVKYIDLPQIAVNIHRNCPEIKVTRIDSIDLSVGEDRSTTFTLKNIGEMEAKDVKVTLTENLGIIDFLGPSTFSIANIEPGHETTLNLQLRAKCSGNTSIDLLVEYSDLLGKPYRETSKMNLRAVGRREQMEVIREISEKNFKSGVPFKVITKIRNTGECPLVRVEVEEPLKLSMVTVSPEKQIVEKIDPGEEIALEAYYTIFSEGEFKIPGARIMYTGAEEKRRLLITNHVIVQVEQSEPNIRVYAESLDLKIGDSRDLIINITNEGPVPIYRFSLNVPQPKGNFGSNIEEQVPFILSIENLDVKQSRSFRYLLKGMKPGKVSRIFNYIYYTSEGKTWGGELRIDITVSSRPHSIDLKLKTDSDVYQYGEPFTLIIDVCNKSDKLIEKVNVALQKDSAFIINSPSSQFIESLSPGDIRTVFFSLTPVQAGTLTLSGATVSYQEEGIERVLLSEPIKLLIEASRRRPKKKEVYSKINSEVHENSATISIIVENFLDEPMQNVTIILEPPPSLRVLGLPVKIEPLIDSGQILEAKFEAEITEKNVKAQISARISYRNSKGEGKLIEVKPLIIEL
ncbi:MAG: hypothetical protein QXR19_14375 [Candidatus Jordarchaeaceae archaeon]